MVNSKKFGSRRRLGIIGGLIVLGLVAFGVRELSGRTPPASSAAAPPAVPVTAAIAIRQDVPDLINAIGTVQSIDSVAIQPRVTGTIEKIEFTPGQDVKQGQELFLIDPRPYQAALDQAKAQLAHDEGVLEEAQIDLAALPDARTAEIDRGAASARPGLMWLQQDKGTVQLDQANVETAQLNLEYCHITAPISGRAGTLLVDLGNLVGSAERRKQHRLREARPAAGKRRPAAVWSRIVQLQPIYVNFSVPQTVLHDVISSQAKGALKVSAYSQAGELLETGALTVIDNQVNTSTGTAALQATFANKDEALWPGEYVSVQLVLGIRRNVVTVPASAVMVGPNGDYIYVIGSNDKVTRVAVQQSARRGGISVISKGISAGQKVVATGQYRLDNGTVVAVQQTTVPQPAAQTAADAQPAAVDRTQ